MTSQSDYWGECVALGCEEAGIAITREQIKELAAFVESGHENYGQAFYSPPATDYFEHEKRKQADLLKEARDELERYRSNAEAAVRRALNLRSDTHVTITPNGYARIDS